MRESEDDDILRHDLHPDRTAIPILSSEFTHFPAAT